MPGWKKVALCRMAAQSWASWVQKWSGPCTPSRSQALQPLASRCRWGGPQGGVSPKPRIEVVVMEVITSCHKRHEWWS
eukprot:1144916-Pelagomonas_calceolata.AAC.9